MPTATKQLEGRIAALENRVQEIEQRTVVGRVGTSSDELDGWLGIVGIFAESPDFEEAVQLGKEWRNQDRPDESAAL